MRANLLVVVSVAAGVFLSGAVGFAQNPPPPPSQYPQQPAYPPPPASQYPQSSQYPPPAYGPPPRYAPADLDRLVSRIALYPDPLLAEVLTASTYYDQIPEAADWANQHAYLRGQDLARAISEDRLPWDPSVQALIPLPSVLDMMAREMAWTTQIGNAVLAAHDQVMDAVQQLRQEAYNYGYLRSNGYEQVVPAGPGGIEIIPVDPGYVYVPAYNPLVVFAPPRRGFAIGAGISFGPGIFIGSAFAPWGWGSTRFYWPQHTIVLNNRPWGRGWDNRRVYVHPYSVPRYEGRRIERHEVRGRSEGERGRR
jgi:hypothetical protein